MPFDNIAKRAVAYKLKERVTYKMSKEYIEAKCGFKGHTAYIAEVKWDFGFADVQCSKCGRRTKQLWKHPEAEKV